MVPTLEMGKLKQGNQGDAFCGAQQNQVSQPQRQLTQEPEDPFAEAFNDNPDEPLFRKGTFASSDIFPQIEDAKKAVEEPKFQGFQEMIRNQQSESNESSSFSSFEDEIGENAGAFEPLQLNEEEQFTGTELVSVGKSATLRVTPRTYEHNRMRSLDVPIDSLGVLATSRGSGKRSIE